MVKPLRIPEMYAVASLDVLDAPKGHEALNYGPLWGLSDSMKALRALSVSLRPDRIQAKPYALYIDPEGNSRCYAKPQKGGSHE